MIFHNEKLFTNLAPILGKRHFLESFVSSIWTLTGPMELVSVSAGAFGSVDSMLNGKKFPQNIPVLRLAVEQLVRLII